MTGQGQITGREAARTCAALVAAAQDGDTERARVLLDGHHALAAQVALALCQVLVMPNPDLAADMCLQLAEAVVRNSDAGPARDPAELGEWMLRLASGDGS